MAQDNFAYKVPANSAELPVSVSIFADRDAVRGEIIEDVEAAGLSLRESGSFGLLMEGVGEGGMPRPLGEVVLVDCPVWDGEALEALSRLDVRVSSSGAQLVIATSVDGLEDVYGCCAQSDPQILVNAGRAERVLALGRVLLDRPSSRVKELSEEDRLSLLRLTEQVGQIASRLDSFDSGDGVPGAGSAFAFGGAASGVSDTGGVARPLKASLPDPRLVRQIIQQRQLRARFLDGDLFADPAWDMLLDLTAARAEHNRVSVTSLCIASGVPPTTALRWIAQMTDAGVLERLSDNADRRRAFIALSDSSADGMARYFDEMGRCASQLT